MQFDANCKTTPRLSPASFNHRIATACEKTLHSLGQQNRKNMEKHNFPSSTFHQKYSSVGQQGSRPHKDLPRSVEPFYDAASPAQAYVKLCETICHFPSALYHTWSDLEGFFPGDVCSGTQNLPSCHFDGENASIRVCPAHFWWVNLLWYPWVVLGGFFWFRAILWMRPSFGLDICWNVLRCSPISAVLSTQNEGIRSFFNWLFVLL